MTKAIKKQINCKVGIANKYTLKIKEFAKKSDGTIDENKVKKEWEAQAFNLVTNTGIGRIVDHINTAIDNSSYQNSFLFDNTSYPAVFGSYIQLGSGDTAPALTDTALDTLEGAKEAVFYENGIDTVNNYAWHTRKAIWLPADNVGDVFKEVGMSIASDGTVSSRALIVDSEGNPLTITKTSTMQIEVYYKFYIKLTQSYGANIGFVGGNDPDDSHSAINFLFALVAYNGNAAYTSYDISSGGIRDKGRIYAGSSGDAISNTDWCVKSKLDYEIPTRTKTTGKLSYSCRFGTSAANGKIKEFGLSLMIGYDEQNLNTGDEWQFPMFRAVLPLTGVYTGTSFTGKQIGVGDGTETEFTLSETDNESNTWLWNEINSGSLVVKVDGVTKTLGVDYTYNDTTGKVIFTTAPVLDAVITADWSVPYIAKSNDYVLDVSFALEFSNSTVPA